MEYLEKMCEVPPSGEVERLLAEFRSAGGVVDFVLVGLAGNDGSHPDVHHQSASVTMRSVARRIDTYFEALLCTKEFGNNKRDDFYRVTFDHIKLQGRQITVGEFVGPMFNMQTGQLLMRGETRTNLNRYFWVGDKEILANEVPFPPLVNESFVTQEYAHAFCEPPHPLRLTNLKVREMFLAITAAVFRQFAEPCTIYKWLTDCSNYFDAGHEWWGSFFWTVHPHESPFVVGVVASTSD